MQTIELLQNQILELSQKIDLMLVDKHRKVHRVQFYSTLDNWFNTCKKPNLSAGALRSLKNVIRILKAHIPNKVINDLLPLDFEKCLNALPMSKTRKDIFIYSRQFMRFCYFNKYIIEDISPFIHNVKYRAKEGIAYTQEQIQTIFANIQNINVLALFKFYYYSGVRRSEAFNLTWQDLDYQSNTLHIHGTKTISSDRFIPLSIQLKRLFAKIPRYNEKIFNVSIGAIRWELEHLKPKVNFNVNVKNFRTTFATRCADIGIAPRVVQAWLGHSDIRTTNKYYIKKTPNLFKQELDIFNLKY